MNILLHHIDLITRCRKRGDVEAAVIQAIHQMLGAARTELHKIFMPAGDVLVGLAAEIAGSATSVTTHDDGLSWPEMTGSIENYPHLQVCLDGQPIGVDRMDDGTTRTVLLLRRNTDDAYGFLVILRSNALGADEIDMVRGLSVLLKNCLALLDYSETDTLTRLLNRKTFDEYLMKILANIPRLADDPEGPQHLPKRRQLHPDARDHWLAVMDIDKFKLINDRYGHMIGDEVLLMLSNLMRESFRAQDMLFRFGGEEFIALLRPAEFIHAHSIFERFRTRVEAFAFPQVGHVTISVGYTRIKLGDTPSFILDSADEALYWAKEHGRNQCHAYETLIETGVLSRPLAQHAEVELF